MALLDGKRIVVTGATSGIGLACAWRLAREGARVAVVSRNLERTENVAREIRDAGFRAIGVGCDITREDDVQVLIDSVCQTWGGVDLLINNAAWWGNCAFLDMSRADFRGWVSEYLEATYFLSQAVAKKMKDDQVRGKIVHIASTAAFYGEYGMSAYCMAKAALVNLTRTMALELGEHGIYVNCVAPGTTIRENESRPEAVMESFREKTPLGHLNTTDDVARAILMMCSDNALGITGQVLPVDAGYSSVRYL